MAKGVIRRLMDRGYGFIKSEQGEDLFFHRSEVQGVEFSTLREGQEVEFDKGKGRDSRPQAVKVRPAEVKVKEELPFAEETTEVPEAVEEDSSDAS
ncbi:cold-shock protein [Chloroflexota bacterium]